MNRELPDGYTVKYRHDRVTTPLDDERKRIVSPKGGKTTATVLDESGKAVAQGVAVCRPDEQFSKRLGRTVALGRALANMPRRRRSLLRRVLDGERTTDGL